MKYLGAIFRVFSDKIFEKAKLRILYEPNTYQDEANTITILLGFYLSR